MGGATSTTMPSPRSIQKPSTNGLDPESMTQIINFILPIYHLKGPLPTEEKDKIILSWKMIINNQLPQFSGHKDNNHTGAVEYFAEKFYGRFIEIHPTSQPMFTKGSVKQGKLFMTMITLIVKTIEDNEEEKFSRMLASLAKSHNPMGVRAAEYSVFGEALFWTLKVVLGPEIYDAAMHTAWARLFSRMLDVIVPLAVKYEFENKESIENACTKRLGGSSARSMKNPTVTMGTMESMRSSTSEQMATH